MKRPTVDFGILFKILEWTFALTTTFGGVVLLVLYTKMLIEHKAIVPTGAVSALIASPTGIISFGVIFTLSGIWLAAGLIKKNKKWRSKSLFLMFLLRLYVLIATIIISGFWPPSWVSPLTFTSIVMVVWLAVKADDNELSSD